MSSKAIQPLKEVGVRLGGISQVLYEIFRDLHRKRGSMQGGCLGLIEEME